MIWLGQLVSLVGSGLTGFALGVLDYQDTGSVTQFALISLFTALPGIVFSPMAGALVDRWGRRWAMILSDTGAGLCPLAVAILLATEQLEVWHVYAPMGLSSTFSAFQWPAYSAATTLLVPRIQLGRASGMVQLGQAAAQIAAPSLAGVLMGLMGLMGVEGVILIDFVTFLFAVGTLLVVRGPRPAVNAEGLAGEGTLLQEAAYGWRHILARPGLLGLLLLLASTNFTAGVVQVLFIPLVLTFASPAVLGTILSIGGTAFLAGNQTMSGW